MNRTIVALVSLCILGITTRSASAQAPDDFKALSFLEGTWSAKVEGNATQAAGRYTFKRELEGHVLARHSVSDADCKGPKAFDCEHGDLLYAFQEAPGQPLKAIYFDNEGHVIHYAITTPGPTEVVFQSEAGPGPSFRLLYKLEGAVMTGKFQVRPPGQEQWRSYLEWRGSRL